MTYSIIVPVYNRPNEVDELLESLCTQTLQDFEVIIVEDGSTITSQDICARYEDRMKIRYFVKSNTGPGDTRNYGAQRADGIYLIILDSDVVLPPHYLKAVDDALAADPVDAFGGPDCAHTSFTPTQKAISYSMTSFFTTGGIRGGKKKLDKFYPRSFNMGIRRDVYTHLGCFSRMRFGEDIDFSIRIFRAGYHCRLFPEAWVWHKRRTDFRKFYRQVYNSGIARINLYRKYPDSLKPVHMLPAFFTVGLMLLIFTSAVGRAMMHYGSSPLWLWVFLVPWMLISAYALLIALSATIVNRSLRIGLLAIAAAFTQLTGYGLGFLEAWWKRIILGKDEFQAFQNTFYQ